MVRIAGTRLASALLACALLLNAGCDGPRRAVPVTSPAETSTADVPAADAVPANPAEQRLLPPAAQHPAAEAPPADHTATPTTEPPSEPAGSPEATTQTKADVGVGKRGRNLGQGVVATPIAAYFAAKEQIAFRVQIPEAMKLYKATNGKAPQTHEEFMKEIVQANAINLPDLPAGHKYLYDPQSEELMVEQPAR